MTRSQDLRNLRRALLEIPASSHRRDGLAAVREALKLPEDSERFDALMGKASTHLHYGRWRKNRGYKKLLAPKSSDR